MDVGHNEGKTNLEGTKLSKSNQRMTLEAYLGNKITHRNKLNCCNHVEMKLK
jgi:hypothetical protein